MHSSGSNGAHLVQDDADAKRGRLPGRFGPGKAAADDVNHGTILRFDGLAAAAPGRGAGGRRAGRPASAGATRRGGGIAAHLEQLNRLLEGQGLGV